MSLRAAARDDLDSEFSPAGYNISINDGVAAEQTVPHLQIHLIPWSRYPRDLAHNLVLAHGTCNARKSDLLGGEVYLDC